MGKNDGSLAIISRTDIEKRKVESFPSLNALVLDARDCTFSFLSAKNIFDPVRCDRGTVREDFRVDWVFGTARQLVRLKKFSTIASILTLLSSFVLACFRPCTSRRSELCNSIS
jgi:hypothetical protein